MGNCRAKLCEGRARFSRRASAAPFRGRIAHGVLCLAVLVPTGLVAQAAAEAERPVEAAAAEGEVPAVEFTLLRPTRNLLADFQDRWIDWTTSVRGGDRMGAETAADLIMANAREFGLQGLPDLSLGAGVLARTLAAEGATDRAAIALAAAEKFDPGRPETKFAEAVVARSRGEHLAGLRARMAGLWRAATSPGHRGLLVTNLAIWFAIVLHIGGGLFVCVLMAARGGALVKQLARQLEDYVPLGVALALVVVLLLWPVTLSGGLAWLMLYWSVLLWSYGRRVERALLAGLWLLLAFSPMLVQLQLQSVGSRLASPIRAVQDLERERMRGSVFTDLGAMQTALPESAAVEQVAADLHRRLRQWGPAVGFYTEVLKSESGNTAAYTGLGVSYLQRGDQVRAMDAFEKATTAGPPQPAAYFHRSSLLSAQYAFTDSRSALEQARLLDREAVDSWVAMDSDSDMVAPDGGIARVEEIETALRRRWEGESAGTWKEGLGQLAVTLPVAIVFLALASGLYLFLGRPRPKPVDSGWWSGRFEQVRRVLVPGLAEAEHDRWVTSFLAVFLFAGLAALPIASRLGYPISGVDPRGGGLLTVVVFGLAAYWLVRAMRWWKA